MIQPMNIFKGIFAIMVGFLSFQANIAFAQTTPSADVIEEVVVYSIRKSLESALAEKRNKNNLTEVINADDIGKLPDENVAEVLENIPGVQITRSAGIGQTVSIRGSDQNRVEINGRGTTSSGDDRGGMSFSDLPASLVRSLNVVKVPTADMVEGSIGGTINVKTYRGLRLKKPLRVARFSKEYAENSDKWNDNFSLTLGKKFETEFGDIGSILTFSHIDKTVREDTLEVRVGTRRIWGTDQSKLSPWSAVSNDPPCNPLYMSQLQVSSGVVTGSTGTPCDPYYKPSYGVINYGLQDRKNNALSGSIEWQVNPGFKVYVESSFTDYEKFGRDQSAILGAGNSNGELDDIETATFETFNLAGIPIGVLTSGKIAAGVNDGIEIKTRNGSNTRNTKTFLGAVGAEWQADDWLVELEITSAGSDTDDFLFQTVFKFNDPNSPDFYNESGAIKIPFMYDIRDGDLSYGPIDDFYRSEENNPLLDQRNYALSKVKDSNIDYKNREESQKIDFTRALDHNIFSNIKFGYRASQRSNVRQKSVQQLDWEDDPALGRQSFPELSGEDFGLISDGGFLAKSPGNFFEFNQSGVYLDNFLTADGYEVHKQINEMRALTGLTLDNPIDPFQGFTVKEETEAAYLMTEFFIDLLTIPAKGNIGVRFIDTNQVVTGYAVTQVNSASCINTSYTSNCYISSPISVEQNYSNSLPSASLVLSPIEKLQVRFGYAEILRRPNFSQISPTVNFPLNTSPSVHVGVPELRPTTAEQYDLSVEYYFKKGSVLSIGYYEKDLHGVIGTEQTKRAEGICNPYASLSQANHANFDCELDGETGYMMAKQSPLNLPGGKIRGFEVAYQHNLNHLPKPFDGLGIIANYAYQDGKRDQEFSLPYFLRGDGWFKQCEARYGDTCDATFPLNFLRLSEESFNLTIFFEKPRYRWSGRLRYTYRDSYLVSESSDLGFGQPIYADGRGQLNGSMSYRIDDVFSLTFSGTNLTKEIGSQRVSFSNGPVALQKDADRRFALGIRAKF